MRTERQLKTYASQMVFMAVTAIFSFIYRRYFLEILGVDYLGVSGVFSGVVGMLSLAELGIGASIGFSLYKPIAQNDQHKVHLLIWLFRRVYNWIGAIILVVGVALTPFLPDLVEGCEKIPHFNIIYWLTLLSTVLTYFLSYNSTMYAAHQQAYKTQNVVTAVSVVTMLGTFVVLLLLKNYIAICVWNLVLTFSGQVIVYRMARKEWPWLKTSPKGTLDREDKAVIIKNIKAMFFHQVGSWCIYGTDNLVIAKILGLTSVGMYANYYTIVTAINRICQSFFFTMGAGLGNAIAVESKKELYGLLEEINFYAYAILGFAVVGFLVSTDNFIILWIGKNYVLDQAVLFFIGAEMLRVGLNMPIYIFKDSAGMYANDKYMPLIQSAINLSVSIIFAKMWGLSGVFFGTMVSGYLGPALARPYVVYHQFFHFGCVKYFCVWGGKVIQILALSWLLKYALDHYYHLEDTAFGFCIRVCIVVLSQAFFLLLYYYSFFTEKDRVKRRIGFLKSKLLHKV